MTTRNLIEFVQFKGIEAAPGIILALLNEAQREFCLQTECLVKTVELSATVSGTEYTLPSDFIRTVDVHRAIGTPAGTSFPACMKGRYRVPPFGGKSTGLASGSPAIGQLGWIPHSKTQIRIGYLQQEGAMTGGTDGSEYYTLTYVAYPSALADPDDTSPDIPDGFHLAIAFRALEGLYRPEQQQERSYAFARWREAVKKGKGHKSNEAYRGTHTGFSTLP